MENLQNQFIQAFLYKDRWRVFFVKGLEISLIETIAALAIGLAIGIVIAVIRTMYDQNSRSRNPLTAVLNAFCKVYTTVIRGIPMFVQLLIFGFVIFRYSRNMIGVGMLSLGINSGAYVAEIIRGGIMSIDPGQMEAGRSLGLGYTQVMRSVVIPQAVKNILPALGNEFITLFKDTSLLSAIGVAELTKAAVHVQGLTYQPFMPYFGAAAMYLIVVLILTWLQGKLERRLRRSDRI